MKRRIRSVNYRSARGMNIIIRYNELKMKSICLILVTIKEDY